MWMMALLLALGCREERTWYATLELAPGGVARDVWMATIADEILVEHDARNCAPPELLSNDEAIGFQITDYDAWAGECWALVDVSLAEGAQESHTAQVEFTFDLCEEGGGCPPALTNTVQVRTLRVVPTP